MDNKGGIDDVIKTGKVLPVCLICNEVPAGGIRDGIKLKRGFICSHCEGSIIGMQPGSSEYEEVIGKLRAILT